jgi:tetratricopeptide (TPR) repeat protein
MVNATLMGRDAERDRLFRGLDALGEGRGSLSVLCGEPGIGKTALADAVSAEASRRGIHVARGAAWDGGDAPAYWPWIEVLRGMQVRAEALEPRLRRDLGPLLGEEGSDLSPGHPDLAHFRRFDALRAVLSERARGERWLLVLEDLHAADRASLLALHYVARSLRALPVAIVATHRDAEARLDAELGALLAKIAREGNVLELARLARSEVAALVGDLDPVDEHVVDEVFEASGGNPLFVHESVRLLRAGARLRPSDGTVALLRDRLARLPVEDRALLELAALLGREVETAALAHATGASVDSVHARLLLATRAGIVEVIDPERVRFAHALFRQALEEDIEPSRRAELHARVAESLAERQQAGADVGDEAIARHFAAAIPFVSPERAIAVVLRAAEALCAGLAFDRASVLYTRALEILGRVPHEPARAIDIELKLAEALARSGRYDRARELCTRTAARARLHGHAEQLAQAALLYGSEIRIAIVDPVLVSLLEEAEHALGEGAPSLRARLMGRRAAALQPADDPRVPMEIARAALALASDERDPETRLAVVTSAGAALVDFGPPRERLPLSRELIALATRHNDLVLAQRGYGRLLIDALELGEIEQARSATEAFTRLGEALGHARWRWRSLLLRSTWALLEGRWSDAEQAQAEAAAEIARAEDPPAALTLAVHRAAALLAREPASVDPIARAVAEVGSSLDGADLVCAALSAALHARLGHADAARRALDGTSWQRRLRSFDAWGYALLSSSFIDIGDPALAEPARALLERAEPELLDRAAGVTSSLFGLTYDGPGVYFVGGLLGFVGELDRAAAMLEDAVDTAERVGARPAAARARHLLARTLVARNAGGDRTRALTLARRARAEASALGFAALGARIEALLADPSLATVRVDDAASVSQAGGAVGLTRAGDVWTLTLGPDRVLLRHSRAVDILARVVASPGRPVHVLELAGEGEPIDIGDAGPALDAAAKQQYKRRIDELRAEVEQAEAFADPARCGRARAELEFLEHELSSAVGLGGRDRRTAAAAERARINVQKRIRGVVRKVAETSSAVASHLEASIRTGTFVVYDA